MSERADKPEGPPSAPRRMMAVAVATVASVIAYWAVIVAVASASQTGTIDGTTGVAVAIGFLLIPVAFFLLSWLSRSPSLVRSAGFGSVLALVIWTWVPFAVGEPVSPFAAAMGAGGAVALRVDPPHRVAHRLVAVAALTIYVAITVRLAFGFALIATPFLPLASLLGADHISDRLDQ